MILEGSTYRTMAEVSVRGLFGLLVAVTMSGCVYDWELGPGAGDDGVDTETVSAGGSATCASATSCKRTCPQGGCQYRCESGARCEFTCAGGGCSADCVSGAQCTNTCSGGGCTYRCASASECTNSCLGGACEGL